MTVPATPDVPEWYAAGLRFQCSQCGNCCTGGPGAVWYAPDEAPAMAAILGLDVAAFEARYTRTIGARRSLNERKTRSGFDCVFLDRSEAGRASCLLYEARPMQCRTWPFWPENLTSPEAWRDAKRRTPCAGMGVGTLVPIEAIRIQRDAKC